MYNKKELTAMLDLMPYPGFCVQDGIITHRNLSATRILVPEGAAIADLLESGQEEYAELTDGCLYLTMQISGQFFGASAMRMRNLDVFILDSYIGSGELTVLALAAKELREPLSRIMLQLEQLNAFAEEADLKTISSKLNQQLMQMNRIVGNMSDAGAPVAGARMELRDVNAVLQEIFDKARVMAEYLNIRLTYEGTQEQIFSLIHTESLERCILNIIANSLKFSADGGCIRAGLTRRGRTLQLRISDNGSGIPDGIRSSVFRRYLRLPAIEDRRSGIGLGMVIIRKAAVCHGGSVLIDQPESTGTRITLTIPIRQDSASELHSPVLRVDYAGELDHTLLELSESLPYFLYEL